MNTKNLWMRLLMASTLLALLFTTACSIQSDFKGPAEEALTKQGDVIMTILQSGDFQAVKDVFSLEAQRALNIATGLVGDWVDLESLIMQYAPTISDWDFDSVHIFTEGGAIRGVLEGKVNYAEGKHGKVHMELELQNGSWKLHNFSLDQ
ncbi:MAG TPA: hypothetical protein VF831_10685 [Anaerolineales bacterium]